MQTLEVFSTRQEAEIVKALLADHGIQSLIIADDQGGLQPSLSFVRGVQLKVSDGDLRLAKQVLENAKAP